MKRKFITGLILLIFIAALFSIFLHKSLKSIADYQKIKNDHQVILTMYLEILSRTQKALIDLYQFKSGYREEFDSVINNVLKNDEIILRIRNVYASHESKGICSECHDLNDKFSDLSEDLLSRQETFKNAISPFITSSNAKQVLASKKKAFQEGDQIINSITDLWIQARTMNDDMHAAIGAKEIQSQYLIGIFFFLTLMSSLVILIMIVRSITNPVQKLVTSMKMISAGNFDCKVDIASNDEFGYLAGNLNNMANKLRNLISERDAVTKELKELTSTLEHRINLKKRELQNAHDSLLRTEGLAIAGTIASSVAHDLSTPFSTLRGYCQLINSKIPKESGLTKYCQLMEKEIVRCLHIMKGMLNLTKLSDEKKSLININAMISDLLFFMSGHIHSANVSIKDELDPAVPDIKANGLALRQVFMNILINALQAMPDGGEIRIASSLVDEGKNIMVTISDTGNGISEANMNNIFELFYTTKSGGTGLGLPICYAIIKAHNGGINVRSEIGKGTMFDVFLPV